jgi:hypothetical protein
MTWQRNSPEVIVKVFKKCCTCNAMNETDGDMLLNGCEERNVRSVRKMKALTVKMVTVILIGKGKIQCDTLYVLSIRN